MSRIDDIETRVAFIAQSKTLLNDIRDFLREPGPRAGDADLLARRHDRMVTLLKDILSEHSRLLDDFVSVKGESGHAHKTMTEAGVGAHASLSVRVLQLAQMLDAARAPIPMRLHCTGRLDDGSMCGALHIDEGEFATRVHRTHACQRCGHHFQPALVPTVGVRWLPGCKNERPDEDG